MSSSLSNEDSRLGESNRSSEEDGGKFTAYESRFQSQRFDSSLSDFETQPENGPILPPPSTMGKEEGFTLREWRRLNALRLEEKEKKEKEMVQQIIETAEQYKADFYTKRSITIENNKKLNREKEKLYLENQEKFYAEAEKNNWKAIAELIPREVPIIEKQGKKKNKKQASINVIQGPKPGKPTDLSRMRQVLTKLKHNPPAHMMPKLPTPSVVELTTE
ncbi:hypothetical protein AALP_AA5G143900 [Arabis alpina]|uniref:Clathrin light chain n=1 Tax=Arabis alpina TaxID=50452 RepID=A0A087GX29_ARAAL|nr:hypothetical protein AALP_AA5G143900 [Arabis alpina]